MHFSDEPVVSPRPPKKATRAAVCHRALVPRQRSVRRSCQNRVVEALPTTNLPRLEQPEIVTKFYMEIAGVPYIAADLRRRRSRRRCATRDGLGHGADHLLGAQISASVSVGQFLYLHKRTVRASPRA